MYNNELCYVHVYAHSYCTCTCTHIQYNRQFNNGTCTLIHIQCIYNVYIITYKHTIET